MIISKPYGFVNKLTYKGVQYRINPFNSTIDLIEITFKVVAPKTVVKKFVQVNEHTKLSSYCLSNPHSYGFRTMCPTVSANIDMEFMHRQMLESMAFLENSENI